MTLQGNPCFIAVPYQGTQKVPFLLHERNEQKYHLEILCEAIVIQIIEVDAHFVGIDHGVVVFHGDFSSPTLIPQSIRAFHAHIDYL